MAQHKGLSRIPLKALRPEDRADLRSFRERGKEPTVTYEALLKDLKKRGKI